MASTSGTIDVHHHFIPPRFTELWNANIEKARGLILPTWSPEGTLGAISSVGLGAAVISLGHPVHPYVSDQAQVGPVCREINQYAAKFRDQHRDRLGFFATLPPLDRAEACIDEIRFALDELGADGVVVFTSYAGKYLGHPDFQAAWQELNHRSAVILVHPGFEGMRPMEEPRLVAPPVIDWTHETTRTAVNLIISNTMRDCANCKVILSHAGGTLPYIIYRAANLCARLRLVDCGEEGFIEQARKFYIDVAFSAHDPQLTLLKQFASPGHVLFGSDYPWEQDDIMAEQLAVTDAVFASETRDAGLALFPRLKKEIASHRSAQR